MTTKRGRPRSFDQDTALDAAMGVFWRHGYEGTSMAALTEAMGLNPPSVYAAFGGKRELFDAVVARYQADKRELLSAALSPDGTAREAIERVLRTLAEDYTEPSHPPGCLVISAAVNCSPAATEVEASLRAHREASKQAITERIAADHPDRAESLGRYVAAVVQGMSTQARDGAGRAQLHDIVDTAMLAWPRG